MNGELKPCPFCGHTGLDFVQASKLRAIIVSCAVCGASIVARVQKPGEVTPAAWWNAAKQEAIHQWNTRASSAPTEKSAANGSITCSTCRGVGSHGEPPIPCTFCNLSALSSSACAPSDERIAAIADNAFGDYNASRINAVGLVRSIRAALAVAAAEKARHD